MTSSAIPKEQLTAFERWELPSFDAAPAIAPVVLSANLLTENAATAAAAAAAVAEAAALNASRQQAHDEGYTAGHQAGYAAGIQQGQAETARLLALMENLQIALTQVDEQLAQSLLDLSLEIARKMVADLIQIKPDVILKIISSAISSLPHFNQNAHLIMNPLDADLVRKQMGEELAHAGWKIFTDNKIEQGGCRIETAHSNIDATNPARWQNIVESIGQHQSWLMT